MSDCNNNNIQYLIQSEDSININTNEYFFPLLGSSLRVKNVRLDNIIFPPLYNVTEATNTILFDEGFGVVSASISIGSYDINTLLTTVGISMTAAGVFVYFPVFSPTALKSMISSTGTFILISSTVNGRSLSDMLGFTKSQIDSMTAALSHTAVNLTDLIPFDTVFLDIREVEGRARTTTDATKHGFIIPLKMASNGSYTLVDVNTLRGNIISLSSCCDIQNLTITFKDNFGNSLNFRGLRWTIYLTLNT